MKNVSILLIFAVILIFGVTFVSGEFYTKTLSYSKNVNFEQGHTKEWGYIDQTEYNATLNDGDSINIGFTVSGNSKEIDVTEFRFYNICNDGAFPKIGRFYTKVNNYPVLPTIGFEPSQIPVWVGMPECPIYGSTQEFIFDTADTKGNGTFHYSWVYRGYPMKIKSLEYYVNLKN